METDFKHVKLMSPLPFAAASVYSIKWTIIMSYQDILTLNSGKTTPMLTADIEAPATSSSTPTPCQVEDQYYLYQEHSNLPNTKPPTTATIALPQETHQPPLIFRINIDGQDRGMSRPRSDNHVMTIRRAYPSTLLEGKLSEKEWIDEFCDPVDEALESYLHSHRTKEKRCYYLLGCWLIVQILFSMVDDNPAVTIFSLFILVVAFHIMEFTGGSDDTYFMLEKKLCSICKNVTEKCNPTCTSGAATAAATATASTETASLHKDGFLQFSLKFRSQVVISSRNTYSYKVYHIELQRMSSSVAAPRVLFVTENPTQNFRTLQSYT